jgi:hypothetical protein
VIYIPAHASPAWQKHFWGDSHFGLWATEKDYPFFSWETDRSYFKNIGKLELALGTLELGLVLELALGTLELGLSD